MNVTVKEKKNRNQQEKHLWAMSNLTKEEKRLELLKETRVPTIPLEKVKQNQNK
jgi:hypothetical protein